jgi:lysylphosphatidylglycerol synthetase-like protein (DUF2156 family)
MSRGSAISCAPESVSVEDVQQALEKYSDNPSAFLALNSGNSYFTAPGADGVIAYRRAGRYLVQLGGAFAPDAAYTDLLAAFVGFAHGQRRKVVAVRSPSATVPGYRACSPWWAPCCCASPSGTPR